MTRIAILGSLLALLAPALTAEAHSFEPGVLRLHEYAQGQFELAWTPPGGAGAAPRFPDSCATPALDGTWDGPVSFFLSCQGLRGRSISVVGLSRAEVVVELDFLDGTSQTTVLREGSPSFLVAATHGAGAIVGQFLRLGVEHILGAFDHLLFVLALCLWVSGWRMLGLTLTCFTLAHSLSLALAVLDVVHVPPPPVEALIALSIVFLALELLREKGRRRPWLVAFACGLLHGLGFAGALSGLGLPEGHIPLALLSFNAGVELGQIAVVLVLCAMAAVLARWRLPLECWRSGLAYAIGSVAAMWTFERVSRFFVAALAVSVIATGCNKDTSYQETRQPCRNRNALRNAYFGDLHVHTAYSFDAYALDTRNTPADAYRFARGESVPLPPLDAEGKATQSARLARPLDFVAVTDHSEYLAEVESCITPGSAGYESKTCKNYRDGNYLVLGVNLTDLYPSRLEEICGQDGKSCLDLAGQVWERVKQAAEDAYDRSAACSFTSFVAYEYTAVPFLSNMHRNVIFKNEKVPFPISYFEEHTPQALWKELKATCIDAGTGCDVLAIPHNSNLSNGNLFAIEVPEAGKPEAERALAELRADMEPLVEIYQHKGDSECSNGLQGPLGIPDELCDFEKLQPAPAEDCAEEGSSAAGGQAGRGCVSQRDFVRAALLLGLEEEERLGANPYRLGIIASTDTHNGTPGNTDEFAYAGHFGKYESTVPERLKEQRYDQGGVLFSGGGLTGVWAEENSRTSLFDALRRRETFGTSGTRITVRFFGGWRYFSALCGDAEMLAKAYADGVPMGGLLSASKGGAAAPTFLVSALRDPGDETHAGVPLQRVQVIKGWIDAGAPRLEVFDVVGDAKNGATVDETTCEPRGAGADALCTVWTDPAFKAEQRAFYYVRVLENPTCRWSARQCLALAEKDRPQSCTDPIVPKIIQERAWTSPIWYSP